MEPVNRSSGNTPILILIALVGLLAYSNTFNVPFQFDDDAYVVNNPAIRSFDYIFAPTAVNALTERSPTSVPPALRYAFMTRTVGYVSLAANFRLHGLNVAGYHAFNLLIHILNGMLVFLVVKATLNTDRFASPVGEDPAWPRQMIPIVSSLLFVCHPIQTQAVTYISQRFASLASFFYLLSLLSYILARLESTGRIRPAAYAASLLSAVAAMLTKEFAFTLPFVIAFHEMTFFEGSARERIRRLAPFAATLLIIPMLVFLRQGDVGALDSTMRVITAADVSNISRTDYLLTQFQVIVLYLRLLFFPVGQNVDHDVHVPLSLFEMPVFLSFLFLLALFSTGVFLQIVAGRRKEVPELRLASFGILWFFVTLSVESSVIPLGELAAEYRMYLPSVGLIVAVVSVTSCAFRKFMKKRGKPPAALYGFFAVVILALSVATYQRNTVWGSEIALWEDAARKSPRKVRPHQNLGTYYFLQGRLEDARRELVTALALDPDNYEIHNNLGLVYKKWGAYDLAVREFAEVLKLNPEDPMAHYNLGNLFLAQGNIPEAIREYRIALERIPEYDEVHNNLGIALEKNGEFPEAIREFQMAIRLNPDNKNARDNMWKTMEKADGSRRKR